MTKSRAEIDKDMMYRKIMPTTARNGRSGSTSTENGSGGSTNDPGLTGLPDSRGKITDSSVNSDIPGDNISPERSRFGFGLQLPESQDNNPY